MWLRFDGRMLQHRQLDIVHLRQVHRRTQVLGQAGTAEREAGLEIGGEIFSCVSWHTRSITSNGSTPSAWHRRAVSLANVIFNAWKLLQQYFIISARAPRCR